MTATDKPLYEKSFFYRYCLVLDSSKVELVSYLTTILKQNDFDVQEVEIENKTNLLKSDNRPNHKLLLLSQTSEKRLLLEAQIRKVRRLTNKEPKFNCVLPKEVLEQESRKAFSYISKDNFISDKHYDSFYKLVDMKKTDDRWGLGLFTESEMLYLEKGILTEIRITNKNELIKLFDKESKEVETYLSSDDRLFSVFEHFELFVDTFPIHTSIFKDVLSQSSLSKIEKCDPHKLRNYHGDYVTLYFYWLDHYTCKLIILI